MSFSSVPGVLPAKLVVKMPLRRERDQTESKGQEGEKWEMHWRRKMGPYIWREPTFWSGDGLGTRRKRTLDEHAWAASAQDWNACPLVLISGLCFQGGHLLYSSTSAMCIPWPSCLILPICRGHWHEYDTHLYIINIPVLGLLNNPQIYIKGTRLEGTIGSSTGTAFFAGFFFLSKCH